MSWEYKTYRVEWVAQCGEVDQYGQNFKPYMEEVRPSAAEAQVALESIAHRHEHLDRWVPNEAPHSYVEARVTRREVLMQRTRQKGSVNQS